MLCFVHIPKTAGTTLNVIFRQSLGRRYTEFHPWSDDGRIVSPADLQMLRRWAPWIKHLGGHHVRAYSGLEHVATEICYVTFLRDPTARYLSDYYHLRHKRGRVANVHEFLGNRAWRNKQTKYIAGSEDLEAAKQILTEKFRFVGLTEAVDESLVLLRSALPELPLDIRYGRPRNKAWFGPAQEEVRGRWKELEPRVLENNAVDLQLYTYVRDVLFPRQRAAAGPQLDREIQTFRETNVPRRGKMLSYKLSRAHYRLVLAAYRRYGRRKHPIDNRGLSAEYDYFGEYVF
jgi:hypothetical protein